MKGRGYQYLQVVLGSTLAGAIAGLSMLLSATPANAQAAYGSYVGIGAAVGFTSDDNGDGDGLSGVVSGRYRFLKMPISLRAQAFFGDGFALVPTVSYDYPLNWNTDIYIGAGIAFTPGDDVSPVGDKTSFVLQPGVDYAFPTTPLVLFGNAVIAFDAFREGGGTAVSIQGGVGYQF